MKEALNAMVQAINDQIIALGTVADQVSALKQMLGRRFPELADDLKAQIQAEHEKNRTDVYQLQVSLAKLREAIEQLPEPEVKVEKRRKSAKAVKTSVSP